mgnify:CR=1 FL=1
MITISPALQDFKEALRRFHLWSALGNMEIKQRYRRSLLGPLWITINLGALIFGVGYIYAQVFDSIHSSYIPYLAMGIVTWNFISGTLTEGSYAFIGAAQIIKNVTISRQVHVFHTVWRNLIIFFHNLLVLIPVYIIYDAFPGWGILGAVIGLVLLTAFLLAASLALAVASARYRDIPPGVSGLLQLTFFATPIIWEAGALTRNRWIIELNPFFHLIECLREPLLNGVLPLASFLVVAGLTLVMAAVALCAYGSAHKRMIFWL